jgi:hypothetical protein
MSDWEPYSGRTKYASNVTGAYYSARLAATEYLQKIKRQAQVIVLREISDEYRFPLGVWVIRVATRAALKKKYIKTDTIDKAFKVINNFFRYPVDYWKQKSRLYELKKTQRKLDNFFDI